uniref:Paraneoplastic antigen Ma-like C-terminal domain-containing protein n=1 Tax=Paramormyrops kingsleyae TaxID=1676925 RepID=A0A3B3Q669_9TELE
MDEDQIQFWCREKGIDVAHAVVVTGVPIDICDVRVHQALTTVKALDISNGTLPDAVGVPDELGPWPIIRVVSQSDGGDMDFQCKLIAFLQQEGKSLAEVHSLVTPPAPGVSFELVGTINSLVDKCLGIPAEVPNYRKLRLFSGTQPVPLGEEEFESWAEQAALMLEEWQGSDHSKRQKIVESIKGPGADVVRFLRAQNPLSTARDYLSALETAFGTTESAADLLVKFCTTYQLDGEKLSTYLFRLDKVFHARMPGAPATFQRVMEEMVGDMNLLEVLVYLDDIIIFGKSLKEHEDRLVKVLDRLKEEGFKVSLDKCQFCRTSVSYVGHIVSRDGVATDPTKVEAVKGWPKPGNVSALRSFLGFCGYYRWFVKNFSKVCYPLNHLLQGCSTKRWGGGHDGQRRYASTEPFG